MKRKADVEEKRETQEKGKEDKTEAKKRSIMGEKRGSGSINHINSGTLHVVYFASVTLGLEFVSEKEIERKLPNAEVIRVRGFRFPLRHTTAFEGALKEKQRREVSLAEARKQKKQKEQQKAGKDTAADGKGKEKEGGEGAPTQQLQQKEKQKEKESTMCSGIDTVNLRWSEMTQRSKSEYRSGLVFFKLPLGDSFDPLSLSTVDSVFVLIKVEHKSPLTSLRGNKKYEKKGETNEREGGRKIGEGGTTVLPPPDEGSRLHLNGSEGDLEKLERFVHSCSVAEWSRALDVWVRMSPRGSGRTVAKDKPKVQRKDVEERKEPEQTREPKEIDKEGKLEGAGPKEEAGSGGPPPLAHMVSPPPLFRATVLRRGDHVWKSPIAGGAVGKATIELFDWKVSLKKFDIEVFMAVVESNMVLGIALLDRPAGNTNCDSKSGTAKRRRQNQGHVSQLGRTSLSPTIANALLFLAELKEGQTVYDPFCGIGTIPVHACVLHKVVSFGSDISVRDMKKARANAKLSLAAQNGAVQLLLCDARRTPFPSHTVHAVVSDLPFGVRSGARWKNAALYKEALAEACRVLVGRGVLVFMTADVYAMEKALEDAPLDRVHYQEFKMGGLEVGLYVYKRKSLH